MRKNKNSQQTHQLGMCYPNAYRYLMDMDEIEARKAFLVHGTVLMNSGHMKGARDEHAWIEMGGTVIDPSINPENPKRVPKDVYYQVGQINEKELKKYTVSEMVAQCLVTRHYGPWD